jgi:hypothetical protein
MSVSEETPDDQHWLDALAGKLERVPAGNAAAREASAVRKAMLAIMATEPTSKPTPAQSRPLAAPLAVAGAAIPQADDALFEKTLFRLKQEGLLKRKAWWQQQSTWGIAASFMLCVLVGTQLLDKHPDEANAPNTLRGSSSHATVLVVSDPELRLGQLLKDLKAFHAEATVNRSAAGQITLTLPASPEVLDYLTEQRIEPVVKEGRVTLQLQAPKASTAP